MSLRHLGSSVIVGLVAVGVLTGAPTSSAAPMLFHHPIIFVGANQSSNWSGYNQGSQEKGGKLFTQVSATWIVPTAAPHNAGEAEFSSTWVGIGGGCVDANCQVTDSTLIQAGTEQDVSASGSASYSAWWEIIPEPSTPIGKITVHAGDKISVTIADNSSQDMWTIQVKDLTNGGSFTTSTSYPSTHLTAEWIEETPVVIQNNGNVSIGPLPKLSTVKFTAAKVNQAGASLVASEELQLVDPNSGQVLATPSAPNAAKTGFNDCTYATSCPKPR